MSDLDWAKAHYQHDITINSSTPTVTVFKAVESKPVILVRPDGKIELGEGCTNAEAAQILVDLANEVMAKNKIDLTVLKRFDPEIFQNVTESYGEMTPSTDGDWVRFTDVEALITGKKV